MDAAVLRWIVAAAWTMAVAGVCAQSPTSTGVIAGRVVIRGESPVSPIRRARVTLDGDAGQRVTDTDTDGRYRFALLPPGSYRVSAAKSGFVTLSAGASRAFVTPPPVVLKAGEVRTVDFALPRGAALDGRVTDRDGEPVENAVVEVSRIVPSIRGLRPTPIASDWTDDLGRYRVHSLPAGAYLIQTEALSALNADVASAGGEIPEPNMRTYYPGTTSAGEAQLIRVVLGEERTGLDYALQTGRASNVSIRVVDAGGAAATTFGCRLQAVGSHALQDASSQARQQRCWFNRVPPGEYWAIARAATTSAGPAGYAVSRIQVGGGDPQEVVLTVEGVSEISGVVEADEPTAWQRPTDLRVDALATLYELPSSAGEDEHGRPRATPPTMVAPDGRFRLPGVFGPTVFRLAGLPPGWALGSVSLAGEDITDREFNVTAGPEPKRLRFVVTNHVGKVTGTVTAPAGSTVPRDTRVIAFAVDERLWGPTSRYVVAVGVQSDGRFVFDGLLPASYLFAATDDLDDDAWLDLAVLRDLSRWATGVTVDAGETARVALRLGGGQ
jgi:hypothetical protein